MRFTLKPKIFTALKGYTLKKFVSDAVAGLIVGIVALPLAIAFAITSGVRPEQGLYTAVVAGFLISLFGGSRVQIGGPTGAFVVIIYGIIQQYGINGLYVATIMAGIILVIMGVCKFGSAIKFIPHPLIVGFTGGVAVIIFSSQIKDLFGLRMDNVPAGFIEKWIEYGKHIFTVNFYAAAVGISALLFIIIWRRFFRKIPGSLIALVGTTLIVKFFDLPVETIGSRFGHIPSTIPVPSIPSVDIAVIRNLINPAFIIALLAAIESLFSAIVADGMIGGKHHSNMELVAQGIANIASPLFGGIPATGAIARTATNIKSGGRTPIAGMIHAMVLFLIMVFFGKWAELIPLTTLAAVLVVVSYNMSEWRSFVSLLKSPKGDIAVLLITFGLTVIVDLASAIEIGIVLSAFLFIRRIASISNVELVTSELENGEDIEDKMTIPRDKIPEGVEVYEINGPFFFGSAYKFKEAALAIEKYPKIRIIHMLKVPAIDATGIHTIEEFYKDCRKHHTVLILSGVQDQPERALEKSGLINKIGARNVHKDIDGALNRANEILSLPTDIPGAFKQHL